MGIVTGVSGHHVSSCWGGSEVYRSHLHHGSPLKIYEKKRDRSERKGDEHHFFFCPEDAHLLILHSLSPLFLSKKRRCSVFFLKIKLTQILAKIFGWSFFNWFFGLDVPNPMGKSSPWISTGVASGSSTTCRAIAVGTHLGTSTSATRCRKNGWLGDDGLGGTNGWCGCHKLEQDQQGNDKDRVGLWLSI